MFSSLRKKILPTPNLPTAKSSTFVFKFFKLATSSLKAIKSFLVTKSDISTPEA